MRRESGKYLLTPITISDRAMEKITRDKRVQNLIESLEAKGPEVTQPEGQPNPHVSFLEGSARYVTASELITTSDFISEFVTDLSTDKVILWFDERSAYFGFLISVDGVVELHYVTISLH